MAKTNQQLRAAGAMAAPRMATLAGCAFLAVAPAAVLAQENADQDVTPNLSVSDRFNQNFGADGIRSGSFLLFPSARYEQIYDDNIFSAPTNEVDDFIANISGALSLQSDWDVHSLRVDGTVRRLQYFENDTESRTDYGVEGLTRLNLGSRAIATFSAGYNQRTEPRRALQTASGESPVRFTVFDAAVEFDFRQNRFREQFGVRFVKDDFDDAFVSNNGNPIEIDQDFRDREGLEVYYRQSVRLRPTVALFAEVGGGVQEFDNDQPGLNVSQDSQSYAASVGIALDINKVARGEIGVGYQKRNFDSDLFDDISGLNIDASLEYFLSDLTTVSLAAQRSIENTAIVGFAGFYSTGGEIRVEHELLRRVMLFGGAKYTVDDFRAVNGVDVDRTDKFLEFNAGAEYAFRRNIVLRAGYRHIDASSDGMLARDGFDENIVQVSIELRK